MNFRLVPNSVTLDDLERRNSPNRSVISPNSVGLGTDYMKVVEYTTILSAVKMYRLKNQRSIAIIYGDMGKGSPQRER